VTLLRQGITPMLTPANTPTDATIDLLFVDEYIVVANKPCGLLVHRGWDNDDDVALFRVRDAVGAHVYPIHRLDRGTSGALLTYLRVVAQSAVDRCSLVEAIPRTGRLHQVRRHLRHLNHPLVGDVNYGSGEINRHYRATYNLRRLALHAHLLALDHPVGGGRLVVRAPMADDLALALAALGLPTQVDDQPPPVVPW
jgi:tRNA pseudouridine65 synthase